jgi:enoyl-CoA hydratase/carnithine racemase
MLEETLPSPLGTVLLQRRVAWPLTQSMLQAGERCAAAQAVQAGLADHLAEASGLAGRSQARAVALAAIPAQAYATNKAWLNGPVRSRLREAAQYASPPAHGGAPDEIPDTP